MPSPTPSPAQQSRDPLPRPHVPEQASWYQRQASAALNLVAQAALPFDAPIIDVGCGLSLFLTGLLSQGYHNLIASDSSATLLDQYRRQLPAEQAERVLWVVDELSAPQYLPLLNPVLLWHDCAGLHGLPSAAQLVTYRSLLYHMVAAHGWVLVGVRPTGATAPPTPPGLSIPPYDVAEWQALLGPAFQLQPAFGETPRTSQGEAHADLYALFQRDETCRQAPWSAPIPASDLV